MLPWPYMSDSDWVARDGPLRSILRIFTHGSTVDVNSFAPRNYHRQRLRDEASVREEVEKRVGDDGMEYGKSGKVGADENNGKEGGGDGDVLVELGQGGAARIKGGVPVDAKEWYHRIDNNGWRPVSEALLRGVNRMESLEIDDGDEQEIGVDTVGVPHHYSNVVRTQDVRRKRRSQRRKWLKDLYMGGAVADSIVPYHADDVPEEDPDFEKEADKLLKWSVSLDFDSYQATWATLATSAGSDALVPAGHMRPSAAASVKAGVQRSMYANRDDYSDRAYHAIAVNPEEDQAVYEDGPHVVPDAQELDVPREPRVAAGMSGLREDGGDYTGAVDNGEMKEQVELQGARFVKSSNGRRSQQAF